MKIMRGDSYPIFISLKQDGYVLKPGMVSDVEICVGDMIDKNYSAGEVGYDSTRQEWYFIPTQEETFALEADEAYTVIARVKHQNQYGTVQGIECGVIEVMDTHSTEVL